MLLLARLCPFALRSEDEEEEEEEGEVDVEVDDFDFFFGGLAPVEAELPCGGFWEPVCGGTVAAFVVAGAVDVSLAFFAWPGCAVEGGAAAVLECAAFEEEEEEEEEAGVVVGKLICTSGMVC